MYIPLTHQPDAIHTPASGHARHEEFSMPIHSIQDAYYDATWRDHALFFQLGEHVGGDQHLRRYQFTNGSYVVIQAHVPKLTYTDASNGEVVAALLVGMGVGVVAANMSMGGIPITNPVTLVGGTALGAVVGGILGVSYQLSTRPYDAAWQGYTVSYYEEGSTQPWGWYRFYGWKHSKDTTTAFSMNQKTDPNQFANFADELEGSTWHKWTTARASAKRPSSAAENAQHAATDQLVSTMASFAHAAPAGAAMSQAITADLSNVPPLLAWSANAALRPIGAAKLPMA